MQALADIRERNGPGVLAGAASLFLLLTGYYGLRPVRDELGVRVAAADLPWLFAATFVTSAILLWLIGRRRRRGGAAVILAFAVSLAITAGVLALGPAASWVARFLFVWITAWSYLLVGLFWQGAALAVAPDGANAAGLIAAGGSVGALAGPAMTATLAGRMEAPALMVLCAGLIAAGGAICATAFAQARAPRPPGQAPAAAPASPLLAITGYIVLLQITATLFYLQQLALVEDQISDPAARTRFFALIDLGANGLALGAQLFLAPRLTSRRGLPVGLSLTPLVAGSAFALIALWPSIGAVAAGAAARRAMEYGVARPAREAVFALGPTRERERFKLWIDAGLTRGGDLAGAWVAALLAAGGGGVLLSGQMFAAAAMLGFGAWAARICAAQDHGGRMP